MTWVEITCKEREQLVDRIGRSFNGFDPATGVGVLSSRTDMTGEFGPPEIFTEWGYDESRPLLRDHLWPGNYAHCEHYEWQDGAR